jgi:hypothetical protein
MKNPRKIVLLALTKGWWFRPLFEKLNYGERVLCFQFVEEHEDLADEAFEAALAQMFSDRGEPKNLQAMIALLVAANDLASAIAQRKPSGPVDFLKRE